ncbi:MAG: hypothetical protein ACTILN_05655 [Marinobacter sp.]
MKLSMLRYAVIRVVLLSMCGCVVAPAYAEQLSPMPRQQLLYEQAELARLSGSAEQAGKILAGMDEGYWSAVGYLNLSGDYARNDLNASRALVALRVALAMADKDSDAQRKTALRSRILLRAGYLAYKSSEYEKAIGFFEKIPLNSHITPQALYFHGLALSEQGNHRAAMQSWHRAKKYSLAYPGVADAWIGMGRGYDLSGYLGQAGEAYLAANAAYESERVTLRKLAGQIEERGAYKALVVDARGAKVDWFLADSRTLTQPRMAYLLSFLEPRAAQEAVNRVVGLAEMEASLERNAQDLDVFSTAIAGQLESPNFPGQASIEEALQDSNARLKAHLSALQQRGGEGGLTPDQRLQLRIMKTTLSDSEQQLHKLSDNSAYRSTNLKALLKEARKLRKQSIVDLESVSALRAQAEILLDRLALDFVSAQDKRMVFALDKTEQQIAHLYEYLALKELDSGEQVK